MFRFVHATAVALLACSGIAALPATAQPAFPGLDTAEVAACVEGAVLTNSAPNGCVAAAQKACTAHSAETPAVIALCYTEAETAWGAATRERLDQLEASAPAHVAGLAQIEAKYDLLAGLVQCDRLDEMGQFHGIAEDQLLIQVRACRASAVGVAYARLLWRVTEAR